MKWQNNSVIDLDKPDMFNSSGFSFGHSEICGLLFDALLQEFQSSH